MKKIKLYLDTSTISHLFAEDTPEKISKEHSDALEWFMSRLGKPVEIVGKVENGLHI